jgi:hypothetical protein
MPTLEEIEAVKQRALEDTPYWASRFGKIVNKRGEQIPFDYNAAQLELDAQFEAQRAAGLPMRGIVLKARQVGMSTGIQGKLVHRATMRERYDTVTVAHDRETGGKLYRMAETMYRNLPPEIQPELRQHRRQHIMHFADNAAQPFPDSRYVVDTAGEFQAGRGGTYRAVHGSEVAFWDQIGVKLTALKSAVPRDPETLLVLESTPNGFNEFKDLWDDAVEGRSGYVAFFWPWWKHADYALDFITETDRERFIVGDPNNPYAEEELDLVKNYELSLEQLNWRRQTIADECNGDVRVFHQEYPSNPEEAFISTGQKVFDAYRIAQLMVKVNLSDPRQPTPDAPGPLIGDFKVGSSNPMPLRNGGMLDVPTSALWVPRERGVANPTAPWKLWLPTDDDGMPVVDSEYVEGVDVSGGQMETTDEPDYHAIEILDHRSGDQVAEYCSRIDPDLLAEQVLLAALFFKMAYVGVERTGGWGLPILRVLYHDFHYPHLYRGKKVGNANEKIEQRLGWDTNQRTKPLLVAGFAALLRLEEDGVKSRRLADEARTYTRTAKGTMEAEPKKYDDCLSAYMIAKQVASEEPLKGDLSATGGPAERGFAAPSVGSYDPRYR